MWEGQAFKVRPGLPVILYRATSAAGEWQPANQYPHLAFKVLVGKGVLIFVQALIFSLSRIVCD